MYNEFSENFAVFLIFALILVFTTVSSMGSENLTISTTLTIDSFQQVILESADESVTVSNDKESSTAKVELDQINSDTVLIKPATRVTVKSNVKWKLLAHIENFYVLKDGIKTYSSKPDVKIQNSSIANGDVDLSSNWKPLGNHPKTIAKGSYGTFGPFETSYKINFRSSTSDETDGAGVDVVYTMMKL